MANGNEELRGISELGESLLSDARQRNEQIYQRNKDEARKMAMLQAGVGMLNNTLQSQMTNFLSNEEMMAARAKQRRGAEDAQFYVNLKDQIEAQGVSPKEYFVEQMMPYAKQRAKEQFSEENFDPDSYNTYIREEVEKLADKKVENLNKGYELASSISSPEDYQNFQALQANRLPTSGIDWLTSSIGSLFGGRSRQEVERDVLDSIVNSDQIKKSETINSLRRGFAQTGDIGTAIDMADAVDQGKLREADGGQGTWRHIGEQTTTGPFGEEIEQQVYAAVNSDGNIISDPDTGQPVQVTKPIRSNLGSQDPSKSDVIESLSEAETATQADRFRDVLNVNSNYQGQEPQELWEKYLSNVGGLSEDDDDTPVVQNIAAMSKEATTNHNLREGDSQRLMSQVMLNRVKSAYEKRKRFGIDELAQDKWNFDQINYRENPDSIEILNAIGDLENTAQSVSFTEQSLSSMLSGIGQDLTQYDSQSRQNFLSKIENQRDGAYSFMYSRNNEGDRPVDVLRQIHQAISMREQGADRGEGSGVIDRPPETRTTEETGALDSPLFRQAEGSEAPERSRDRGQEGDSTPDLARPGEGGRQRPEFLSQLQQAWQTFQEYGDRGVERTRSRLEEQQREQELRPALSFVYDSVNQGELPPKETEEQRNLIQQSIESGELDSQLTRTLREWLNRE